MANFQTSVAVEDVDKLKENCGDDLFEIKVNYCIKMLHMKEFADFILQPIRKRLCSTYTELNDKVDNVVVIFRKKNKMFTLNIDLALEDGLNSDSKQVICRPEENIIIVRSGVSKIGRLN